MKPQNLQQHLAGILDNLEAIHGALENLSNKQDTPITQFDEVNKRISEKIHSYIIQTDKLKLDFLQLLEQDGQRLKEAATQNPRITEEIISDLQAMAMLCDDIVKHEKEDIEYSEKTIDRAKEAQDSLDKMRNDLKKSFSSYQKQKDKASRLNRTNRPL